MSYRTLVLVALVLAVPPAVADLYIVMKTTAVEGEQRRDITTETWFRTDMAANKGSDGRRRIIRFDRRVIWDLDPDTRRYVETSFARMAELEAANHKKQEAQLEQLRAAIADPKIGAEDKARLEKLLSMYGRKTYAFEEHGEEPVEVRDGSGAATTVKARRFTVLVSGKPFMIVWATEELGNVAEFNRLNELSTSPQPGLLDQLRRIRGVWVRWETADGIRAAIATRVATDALDPALFEIPAGYQKRE